MLLPKGMTFAAGSGSVFQAIQQDPNVQTFVAKNAVPGKALEFTVSGEGSMPREQQGDPLSKYKWWILGGLGLVLAAAAAFLLRKPAGVPGVSPNYQPQVGVAAAHVYGSPATKNGALLNALKEELFALESEKLTGNLAPAEYAEVKAALEIVLKRALKRTS